MSFLFPIEDKPKTILVGSHPRQQRFTRPLKRTGIFVQIPSKWEDLPLVSEDQHDPVFVEILARAGKSSNSPVPLITRYSKPRPWSAEELDACVHAHEQRIPVALMSAALNRNPQDIIYRLLDVCHASEKAFREVGLGCSRWTPEIKVLAKELFDAGLTAWRIGALFGVDFEGVEKVLFAGRTDYGHSKRNPFAICTDHKQEVNRETLRQSKMSPRVLDAFAGEGRFAALIEDLFPTASQLCIEQNPDTFERAHNTRSWASQTRWILDNNIQVMKQLAAAGEQFDIVDLDPFVSCRDQIDLTWPLLKNPSSLFVTFGGEYRRSFIRTNRQAIGRRYGFYDAALSNSEYLEIVPSFFLGWLASQASRHGFIFDVECCVRYPNNCRFWLTMNRREPLTCQAWLNEHASPDLNGFRWGDLRLPRFSELRAKAPTRSRGKKSNTLNGQRPKLLSSPTKQCTTDTDQLVFEL